MAKRRAVSAKKKLAKNKAELARALGITDARIAQLSHSWPFAQKGPFDVEAVRAWWRANFRPPAPSVAEQRRRRSGAAGGRGSRDSNRAEEGDEESGEDLGLYTRSRIRLALKQSDRLEMQIRALNREFIPRKDAQQEAAGVFAAFRSALEALPGALADALDGDGLLAASSDGAAARDGVEKRTRTEVDRILKQLADGIRRSVAPRE